MRLKTFGLRTMGCAALVTLALASIPANAHRQWMLPSATNLSGENPWVTVDAAISNDLFYFEHVPMGLDNVRAYAPDGSEVAVQNKASGRYRSVFDVELKQQGTYKIVNLGHGAAGKFKQGGVEKRLPRGLAIGKLAEAVPADATDLDLSENLTRNEIFVTVGSPTQTVLKPTGKGIELAADAQPTDLVAGEPTVFQFLLDGKPAANIKVTVIPGGIRYRDQLNQMDLTADAQGKVTIDWQEPGMYWLNATASDEKSTVPNIKKRRMSYITTLEVQAP